MGRKQDSLRGVRFVRFQRDQLQRAVFSLVAWLAVAACLTLVFWRSGSEAAGGLFQSDLPTPAPTSSPTADMPTETPSPTAMPVLTVTIPVTVTTPTSTETPVQEPTQGLQATAAPLPAATLQPTPVATALPSSQAGARYPEEGAGLKFSWRTLIDALALGVSYVWLGCGVGVLLLLVILLLRALVHRQPPSPGR